MRSYYFQMAANLSAAPALPSSFFSDAKILLSETHLSTCVQDIRGPRNGRHGMNVGTAAILLQHVLSRTLPFKKLVEHITVDDIRKGMPNIMLGPAGLSEKTIRDGLAILVERGFLVRINTDYNRTRLYGLNLPMLIDRVASVFDSANPKEYTEAHKHLTRIESLRAICNRLHTFYVVVRDLTIRLVDLKKLVESLKERFSKIMAGINQMVDDAKRRCDQKSVTKRLQKGARMFRADGKADGSAGMDFWNGQVQLRKEDYPSYTYKKTGKMRGMMKNWLEELRSAGMDAEQVRQRITEIIEGWHLIRNQSFTTLRTNAGRTVPSIPDFEYYYTYRTEINALLHGARAIASRFQGRPMEPGNRVVDF